MKNSNIQWTDHTWNIARGCTKVDEDCKFCYMYRDSMDSTRYNPLQVVRTKTVFNTPLKIKEPECPYCHGTGKIPFDWVIVGGESGNNQGKYRYRECKLEWIESIVDQCKRAGVPVFVKQLGTHLAKQLELSDRHGGNIEEWPQHLRVREFPKVKEVANG